LNGKATDPSDLYRLVAMEQYHKSPEELIYNRAENPFYDAEVEEDLKMIQRRYEEKEEMKKRKLRKKMLKSSLESIPHIEYHPDDVVIQMAKEQEGDGDGDLIEEKGRLREGEGKAKMSSSVKEQRFESEVLRAMIEKQRETEKDTTTDNSPIQTKKRNGKGNSKKLRYEGVYGPTLGPLEQIEAKKQSLRTPGRTTLKATGGGKKGKNDFQLTHEPVVDEGDVVYSQVMQPFEEYFNEEAEKEKLREQWMKEREEIERKRLDEMAQQESDGEREEEERYGDEDEERYDREYEESGTGEREEEERYDSDGVFEQKNSKDLEGEEEEEEAGMEL
jgi:hypothetical protein